MFELLSKDVSEYAEAYTTPESKILQQLNRETHIKVLNPRMLSGHMQGMMLQMISHMIRPERILELGTYTGYSAICLAQGLSTNGIIHTIEYNIEQKEIITRYINEAGLQNKIKLMIGDAMEIIPTLTDTYNLVFIDADKENYLNYYEMIMPKLRAGGFILIDNVLWDGKVLYPGKYTDEETKTIVALNEHIKNDTRVEQLLLPFRDGLSIVRKK